VSCSLKRGWDWEIDHCPCGKIDPPKKYYLGADLYDELENILANPVPFGGNDFFKPVGSDGGERFF
jgi:aldehyde oxidoreductase